MLEKEDVAAFGGEFDGVTEVERGNVFVEVVEIGVFGGV